MASNSTNDLAESASGATPLKTKLAMTGAWLAVGLPLLWGIGQTFRKVLALFRI
ncbi:MAG TPA: hypothetical protein VGP07_10810 [Polyangia bacterium]|jgi:hypothetical protein